MNQFDTKYRSCPNCTYPLHKMLLGIEDGKQVIRTYCSNKRCGYERIRRIKNER